MELNFVFKLELFILEYSVWRIFLYKLEIKNWVIYADVLVLIKRVINLNKLDNTTDKKTRIRAPSNVFLKMFGNLFKIVSTKIPLSLLFCMILNKLYKDIGNVKSSKPVKAEQKMQTKKNILHLGLIREFNSFIKLILDFCPKKYFLNFI